MDIGERSIRGIRVGKECKKGIKEHKNGNEGSFTLKYRNGDRNYKAINGIRTKYKMNYGKEIKIRKG